MVETICYKSESRGSSPNEFIDFSPIYLILPGALGPGIYPVFNRNEYLTAMYEPII
jgi:hypothetical protein